MTEVTPMDVNRGDLNSAPPSASSKGSILDIKPRDEATAPATNSMQAIQGLAMIRNGARIMSVALPELAQPLMQMVQQLETIMPRALAQGMGNGNNNAPMSAGLIPPPPQ